MSETKPWVEITPKIDVEVEVELYSGKRGLGWYGGDSWTVIVDGDGQLMTNANVRAWRYITHD